jgi:hypothetical protein
LQNPFESLEHGAINRTQFGATCRREDRADEDDDQEKLKLRDTENQNQERIAVKPMRLDPRFRPWRGQ